VVGAADPDRHGALVFGELTRERRQALPGHSDLVFRVSYQECLDFDPAKLPSLQRLVERLDRAPRGKVGVEAVLKGAPAGNVRGIIYGVLVAQGQEVATLPVANRDAWWQRGRLRIPGAGPVEEARETVKRWVVGLDLEMSRGAKGTDSRAMHISGLLQAACMARFHALKLTNNL
jgi:hypothetical protein